MKKIYALLFHIALITTCSVAKSNKIETKYQHNKNNKTIQKKLNKKDKNYRVVHYKLKVGDTLKSIAKKYHTRVSTIVRINKLNRDERLKTGMVLKVPTNIYTLSRSKSTYRQKVYSKSRSFTYKIKKGDTLTSIARRANTTVAKLEQINKFSAKRKKLRLGETIQIPKAKKVKQKPRGIDKVLTKIANLTKIKKPIEVKRKLKIVKKIKTQAPRIVLKKNNKNKKIASYSDSQVKFSTPKQKSQTTKNINLQSLDNATVKLSVAKKHLGKRYVWGAVGPKSFDCSGFTKYVCKKSGISLPRTSINQSRVGKRVARANLVAGDLLFFDTSKRRKGYINHVGIYIGNNKFIHASSGKRKVVITSLNKPFYKSRFKWGSRVES